MRRDGVHAHNQASGAISYVGGEHRPVGKLFDMIIFITRERVNMT